MSGILHIGKYLKNKCVLVTSLKSLTNSTLTALLQLRE